ncbi:polysaccharide lyase family protein [Paenibacillus stellifer]|uniref:polysaccharide lyase family protein n=1 Tax=Paenibacillus stellifer TaxID=169760 RepID=UPI000691009C|nr:polysaccharide lyase family protein [Paenibacillus stellifer]
MRNPHPHQDQSVPAASAATATTTTARRRRLLTKGIALLTALALVLGVPSLPQHTVFAERQSAVSATSTGNGIGYIDNGETAVTGATGTDGEPAVTGETAVTGKIGDSAVTQSVYAASADSLAVQPEGPLWTIGAHDGSSAEFSDYRAMTGSYSAYLPDGSAPNDWKTFPKGMKASVNKTLSISYSLEALPAYGAEFDVHILNAYISVPQMAVYSNGRLAGLLQIAGTSGSGAAYPFRELYRLYIPKELLKAGVNELKLEVYAGSYATTAGDANLWYEWDELSLTALAAPADEPIHGRYIHLGTAIANGFVIDDNVTRLLPDLTRWLGIAYSGNMLRTGFWSDTKSTWQNGIVSYLQTMKDLNLQPMVGIFGSDFMNSPDMLAGHMTDSMKTYYRQFMASYGSYFSYLEMDNEPGVFSHNQASIVELAQFLQSEKASTPWLKIVAPGWAYWPTKGTPYGWERDPAQRKPIEALSDLTNGHSYSLSGLAQARGGALNENLLSYDGGTDDGLPKEMVMTESGANDLHTDQSKFGASAYKYAAVFDREMRADIGYADHIMQHTAFDSSYPNYALLLRPANWSTHKAADTMAWAANSAEGGETRLRTFRRLAAAYATHGSPLPYSFLGGDDSAGRKIYVRAVDTAGLGTSAVGASADKQIVSVVSFGPAGTPARHVSVRVTLPESGTYRALQYRDGQTLDAAYSVSDLAASPYLDLDLTVAAGEAVQLYLTKEETQAPQKPVLVKAEMATWNTAVIGWNESSDNAETTSYRVYRDGEEIAVLPSSLTSYTDTTISYDRTYSYTVKAGDDSGNLSPASDPLQLTVPDMPVTPGGPLYETEKAQLGGIAKTTPDSYASGGAYVRDMHASGSSVSVINIMPGAGSYTLRVGYATSADATLNLYVNGQMIRKLTFVSTGKASGAGAYKSISTDIALADGPNTVILRHDGGNTGGVNLDFMEITPTQTSQTDPGWNDYAFNDIGIYYSPGITTNDNGSWNETESPSETATFTFTGTGVRWLANVQSNMGLASVYIDDILQETVDLTAANLEGYNKVVFEKTGLADGSHTLKIVTLNGKITFNKYSINGPEQSLQQAE